MELSDDEILDNFIADAKNAELMIERYNRNDITNVSGELDADLLAEKCPDLRIIKISAPTFTTGKKNEVLIPPSSRFTRTDALWRITGPRPAAIKARAPAPMRMARAAETLILTVPADLRLATTAPEAPIP